jgi:chromosome partitioning protein
MKTIAIVNQKGGCGKTTVAVNLASALAGLGQRILLVDMDPQSHCAVGLAVPEEQIEQSIYDVLISRSRNEPIKLTEILWQISDGLELAPASIDLSAFEQQMAGVADRECSLKDTLEDIKADYDYTLIDCPPAVSLLTFNALRAATDIIVPVETGYFALHGLSKQLDTLSVLCRRTNQDVNVKVLATMYDIRTKMAREILAELRSHFGDKMFDTIVTFNTKIKEASSFGQPISEYDPSSKGHKDFRSLGSEILSTQTKQQRHDYVNSLAGQLESISATADELLKAAKTEEIDEQVRQEVESIPSREEFTTVEARAWQELEAAVEEPGASVVEQFEAPIAEEPEKLELQIEETPEERTAAKLSDYYGVGQINDAIVFVTLYPRAQNVEVAGDFNNWQPQETPMQKVGDSGVWQTQLKLPAGRYRYRLVVDGQWQQDPYNELTELNPFGEYNSVVEIK